MTTQEPGDYSQIVNELQRHAGNGQTKIIRITGIFDGQGRLIGKVQTDTIRMYPGMELAKLFSFIVDGRTGETSS